MSIHQTCMQFLKTISAFVLLTGYAKQSEPQIRLPSLALLPFPIPKAGKPQDTNETALLVDKLPVPEGASRPSSFLHMAGRARPGHVLLNT